MSNSPITLAPSHASPPTEAAAHTIESFRREISAVQHTPFVAELQSLLVAVAYELSDAYMDFTDTLSAHLGAEAANQCPKSSEQQWAISRCESFVSDEVSCDEAMLAAAIVVMNGPEEARELIGRIASEAPARATPEMAP